MTAPDFNILVGNGTDAPRRPDVACEDYGGLAWQDDVDAKPNPNEELSSKDWKQVVYSTRAAILMSRMLHIEASWSGSAMTLTRVNCVNDALEVAGAIAIGHPGTGTFTFTWATGKIPPSNQVPYVTRITDGSHGFLEIVGSGPVVIVTSYSTAWALSDAAFKVAIDVFGEA